MGRECFSSKHYNRRIEWQTFFNLVVAWSLLRCKVKEFGNGNANLFGTTEDLYTQTIVIPYLFPMLENAGAVVVSPRERDWQKQEVIVDNDNPRAKW